MKLSYEVITTLKFWIVVYDNQYSQEEMVSRLMVWKVEEEACEC